jgi:hypothetical protein
MTIGGAMIMDGRIVMTTTRGMSTKLFSSGPAQFCAMWLLSAARRNNDPATPFLTGSIAIYSQATQKEVGRYLFTQSYFGTPNFPLAIATLSDGSKTYVSSERDGAVYDLNTSDPAARARWKNTRRKTKHGGPESPSK